MFLELEGGYFETLSPYPSRRIVPFPLLETQLIRVSTQSLGVPSSSAAADTIFSCLPGSVSNSCITVASILSTQLLAPLGAAGCAEDNCPPDAIDLNNFDASDGPRK
jgi:hypothetical protein